jgi:hypothetical protein
MEKLNFQRNREDFYILEVNEKGETIEFDLTDINLPDKILKASENVGKLDKEYMEKIKEVPKDNEEEYIKKMLELQKEMFSKMRKEMDSFMGDGACKKIFGEAEYYGMFLDLMEQLEPHFDKMIIKADVAKKRLVEKYMPSKSDVI